MAGLFKRARKAIGAFIGAFIAAVALAAQEGTVFHFSPLGINWDVIGSALGLAAVTAAAVFGLRNVAVRKRIVEGSEVDDRR
jgi:hypothetical protein